jgi:hypothetical protein
VTSGAKIRRGTGANGTTIAQAASHGPCGAAHAHVGDPRFIAPTLSFSIEFQHRTRSAGLLSDAHAPSATEGRIVVHNRVWSPDGLSLATGSGTLICRSRPQR